MAKIKDYIDACIKNKQYTGSDKSNMFSRIRDRVQLFVGIQENGSLSLSNYKGLDRLIAERVIALTQGAEYQTIDVSTTTTTTESSTPKIFKKPNEDEEGLEGYIFWAGNEGYKCPWLKNYIAEDSTDTSANPYTPTQSSQFKKLVTGVSFNDSTVVSDQNRQICLSETRVAFFSKDTKKLIISTRNDKTSFESGGASGEPLKSIDLSTHILEDKWSYGKILCHNSFLYVGICSYPDDRTKTFIDYPRIVASSSEDVLGYTMDIYLLVISIETGKVIKLAVKHTTAIQTRLNVIRGYTDFIIHNAKVYAVRTKTTASKVSFTATRLSETSGSRELIASGKITHKFDSYQFEIVELVLDTVGSLSVVPKIVSTVEPPAPEDSGKFGFKGSQIMYTTAKLAASDLNPLTFHVQMFYELVLQLPYDYGRGYNCTLYLETYVASRLRPGSSNYSDAFYDQFIKGELNEDLYGNARLLNSMPGIKLGGITKIAGCLFLEVPVSYDVNTKNYTVHLTGPANLLYELTGESQPTFSPQTSSWELWRPFEVPNDYYPWEWWKKFAAALDIWIAYHAVCKELGIGNYSSAIMEKTGMTLRTSMHEIAVDVQNRMKNKETLTTLTKTIAAWPYSRATNASDPRKTVKWLQVLDVELGDFPFPYEKRYCFFGGHRGTTAWPVSGYIPQCETFLVTYNGTKIAAKGNTTTESARPVYIIMGVGAYSSKWGAKGWTGQMTESPLVVEVYRHETVNGIILSEFEAVNDPSLPKAYMQGNCTVLGTIGDYYTNWIISDPDTEICHGMYPIAQNGYYSTEDFHLVQMDRKTTTDMRFNPKDLREVYYVLFVYHTEFDNTDLKVKMNNYYIETRSYQVLEKKGASDKRMTLNAARTLAYWWSRSIPAKLTDSTPWWGPCQLDMHVKL